MAHGLAIYDSDGNQQILSDKRYFRIHFNATLPSNFGSTITVSVPGVVPDGTWFGIVNVTLFNVEILTDQVLIRSFGFIPNRSTFELYVFKY